VALRDPTDRRGTDAVAEIEQLAPQPQVSPARVLPRHPQDQGGEGVVDRWSSGPVGVGPSSADEAAVPAQDRVRGDQAMAPQRSGQPPNEGREHGSVGPVQAWSWVGAAQDGNFVAQQEEFDVLGGGRAGDQQDQSEYLPEDQVQQPQRHAWDHAQAAIIAGQRPRLDFWHPTGRRFTIRASRCTGRTLDHLPRILRCSYKSALQSSD